MGGGGEEDSTATSVDVETLTASFEDKEDKEDEDASSRLSTWFKDEVEVGVASFKEVEAPEAISL